MAAWVYFFIMIWGFILFTGFFRFDKNMAFEGSYVKYL